jgi:PAS domain S-box-containing protein
MTLSIEGTVVEEKWLSSDLQVRIRALFWPTALIAILLVRALVSFIAKPNSPLLAYGSVSYFLLLLLAAGFVISNAIRNTLGSRSFWVLLAIGYSLWALDQWIFLYHQFVLHTDVPDSSIADPVLFLHIVPFTAAVASLLTLNGSPPKLYRVISNFLLLLFFWGFLYVYAVFPYQYLFSNPTTYALRFDLLYLVENLVLIAVVGILSLRVQYPWKMIYLHLLGASALYALSSAVANTAIDTGGYVYGKIYGLGLTASACWFVWVPIRARQITKAEIKAGRLTTQGSQLPAWAMLVVVMISVPLVWELFQKDETAGMRRFRLVAAVAAIVSLATVAFVREHFAKSELIAQLSLANDRLHLAVEASKSMGWEWDLKTGRLSWFGDLQNIFGIPSDTYVGRREDLYRYVHPEDHGLVAKAVEDARQSRKPYAAEFRVVRADGLVRWIASRGQFYYGSHGDTQRMLGIAVDITERRHAQESLQLFRRLIDESSEAIEVVEPETLRFLDVNDRACHDLGYTRDELLSLRVRDIDPCLESSMARIGKELEESGFVTFETLHQRKDGSTFPVEINLKRVQLDRTYNVNIVRDITERKRVDEALRGKTEELTEAQRLAGLGSWQWDAQTEAVTWSEELYRLHGLDPKLPPPPFKEFPSLFAAESWERLQLAVWGALQAGTPYELDMEIIGSGSPAKWVIARGEPVRDSGGQVIGLRGTVQDITARKLADALLAGVSGKLIEAQEQERRRIARELHDDIGQRLALLSIQLAQIQQSSSTPSEFSGHIERLQTQTSEIAADVQSLSHELHSSRLQYLGLAAALKGFCQEFSLQQKVEVDFKAWDLPTPLSPDISLCFFRVLQEALHNAAKHSGVREFEVRLWGTPDEIHLTISDSGVGFDGDDETVRRGLGLISMQERLRLLHGTLSIESQPQRGTTVRASVPYRSNH